jgi:hypothetical protein
MNGFIGNYAKFESAVSKRLESLHRVGIRNAFIGDMTRVTIQKQLMHACEKLICCIALTDVLYCVFDHDPRSMSNPSSSVGLVDLWMTSFLKRVIEGGT